MSYTPYAAYGSAESLGQAADRIARERARRRWSQRWERVERGFGW